MKLQCDSAMLAEAVTTVRKLMRKSDTFAGEPVTIYTEGESDIILVSDNRELRVAVRLTGTIERHGRIMTNLHKCSLAAGSSPSAIVRVEMNANHLAWACEPYVTKLPVIDEKLFPVPRQHVGERTKILMDGPQLARALRLASLCIGDGTTSSKCAGIGLAAREGRADIIAVDGKQAVTLRLMAELEAGMPVELSAPGIEFAGLAPLIESEPKIVLECSERCIELSGAAFGVQVSLMEINPIERVEKIFLQRAQASGEASFSREPFVAALKYVSAFFDKDEMARVSLSLSGGKAKLRVDADNTDEVLIDLVCSYNQEIRFWFNPRILYRMFSSINTSEVTLIYRDENLPFFCWLDDAKTDEYCFMPIRGPGDL